MKNKWWILTKKSKDVGYSYEVKEKLRYVKGSTIAIILGLIMAMLIVSFQNVNPFVYLGNLIGLSFTSLYINQTIQWISIYVIAGLAIAISFKSGSFNIGVAGQMMLGAGLSIIFVKAGLINQGIELNAGHVVVIFLISILSGALLAGFAGFLKAMFNIHEVVTTIMLNWTVWYLFKYIFQTYQTTLGGNGVAVSASVPSDLITLGSSPVVVPIILALLAIIFVAFMLTKTVFGFKIKAVGISQEASKYSGYNVKKKIIEAMLLSGALAGLASFINVTTITPNLSFAIDNLPSLGYDSIAISLVAFNNPVGILFTSILWGTLQSSGTSTASLFGIPAQLSSLIFGIIVYFAAISIIFMNYSPIVRLRTMMAIMRSRKNQEKLKELNREQLQLRWNLVKVNQEKAVLDYRQEATILKNQAVGKFERSKRTREDRQELNATLNVLQKNVSSFVKDRRQTISNEIARINLQITLLRQETYLKEINRAKSGIERRHFNYVRHVEMNAVKDSVEIHNTRLVRNDLFKFNRDQKINYAKFEKKKAKEELKKQLKTNTYWYEGQFGDLTNYYEMLNTKIENQGEIKKQKIILQNEISSLRADYRFEKSQAIAKKQTSLLASKRRTMNKEIYKLNQNFNKLKAKEQAEINRTKKLYHETLATVKVNGELDALKLEYKKMNLMSKNSYEDTLQKIADNESLISSKFNEQQSVEELTKAKKLVELYLGRNRHEVVTISQADKRIADFDRLEHDVFKILKQTYSDHDPYNMVKAKYHFYAKLNGLWEESQLAKIVVEADNKIKLANQEHNKIIDQYNAHIKKINKEYKFQVKAIKHDSSLRSYERQEQLIVQEEYYDSEISQLVENLENKFLTTEMEMS